MWEPKREGLMESSEAKETTKRSGGGPGGNRHKRRKEEAQARTADGRRMAKLNEKKQRKSARSRTAQGQAARQKPQAVEWAEIESIGLAPMALDIEMAMGKAVMVGGAPPVGDAEVGTEVSDDRG
jgi:hypothetical protein